MCESSILHVLDMGTLLYILLFLFLTGLTISRSRVQILLEAMLLNNLRQVVCTYVPLSPSSITWYRPKGGDALWLGR